MKIIIADPQKRVRRGLRILLEQQLGWVIIGEAADSWALLELVRECCPDLVLVDWGLPGLAGADMLHLLREQFPAVVRITMSGRPECRQAALNAGSNEFISKTESPEKLLSIIKNR